MNIPEYDGLCIITFINQDGSLEPVSDKGDFIPDTRRSLPVKLYNDKKWAKKKIQMYIKHAHTYLEKWADQFPNRNLIEVVTEKYEKEQIHDIRFKLQITMLSEDGTYIRDDANSRAYRCFKILNIAEAFTLDYYNKYADTKLTIFDEIKTMTIDEQVEEFGKSHTIVGITYLERNRGLVDAMVTYVNEDRTHEGLIGEDRRCVIGYLRSDGEIEPISDKGQFVFTDHKAQQFRIYRNPMMAMRKINMFVDHAWVYLDKYDHRMNKFKEKKEWAHGERPNTLINIITDKDEHKLIHKTRFNLMRDMLDETMDKIREDAKQVGYEKILIIPLAPLLGTSNDKGGNND